MQIFVRGGHENYAVEVAESATVADLKSKINIDEDEEYFISFNGTVLSEDESQLTNFGVGDLCSVDVIVRLLGGKVHGSLARAGKVRGQTPKVEKKEKKKKKTGRAKRRMQYRRRFVNVVAGPPGRRRGPNSNM